MRALAELDPADRALIVLRHLLGYRSSELARMFGLPAGTVRTRLARALNRVREQLEAEARRDHDPGSAEGTAQRDSPSPAAQAREQAVAEARAEIAARGRAQRLAPPWRPRLLSLAAVALLAVVVLLTPPGRAASAWVGDLVGIGDVGARPPIDEPASSSRAPRW